MPSPPTTPGTYALIFSASRARQLQIGKLGRLLVKPGFYIYVGSAFGPGGLKARLAHHRKPSRRPHWHVDYLTPFVHLIECWHTCGPVRREHQWAEILSTTAGTSTPLSGFGSSDCRCRSHLFYSASKPNLTLFRRSARPLIRYHAAILADAGTT